LGSILQAKCSCGFDSGELCLGGGRLTFETNCAFPCNCSSCGHLSTPNLFESDNVCGECGKPGSTPYDDDVMVHPDSRVVEQPIGPVMTAVNKVLSVIPFRAAKAPEYDNSIFSWNAKGQLGRDLTLTENKYFCPQCKNYSLTFECVGMWD